MSCCVRHLEDKSTGAAVGRREAVTDHILGLHSKISSLFSLHSPPKRPQKDFVYFDSAALY